MSDARYFLAEHASLKDVYSKDDLRGLLQSGKLSRSDILVDDETGLAHLLGDLLRTAYREPRRQVSPAGNESAAEEPEEESEDELTDEPPDEPEIDPVQEHEF